MSFSLGLRPGRGVLFVLNRLTTGLKYLWWHLTHEDANRLLIEPDAGTSPDTASAQARGADSARS